MKNNETNIQFAPEYPARVYSEKSKSGITTTYFDIDLPGMALKRIPFMGMFEDQRDMDRYCDSLIKNGFSKKFVGGIKDLEKANVKYTLMLTEPIDGKHMYYITLD